MTNQTSSAPAPGAANGLSGGRPAATDLAHIRAVSDLLPQLVWSCRPDGHCDYLSRRWVEYTGVPEGRHHGRGWLDAVHPDDRARTRAVWDAFVAGDAEYDIDYRLRRHDGEYCWFKTRGALLRGEAGDPLRVVGTTTDINDQKRAEERDREGRERLDAALGASGTGTFRWDIRTNALDWDEQLDRLFGLPPGQTVRSLDRFVELVHPDDRAEVIDRCRRCRDEGADFAMEFRVVWPDGSVRWLDDRGRTFRDPAGRPEYMTGACVDTTDRKHAEDRLRELDERAEFVRRASGVGFWYCDLPFDTLEWDDRVKEHFHLPPDAAVTIGTFYDRIHPDDRGPTRAAIERSIAARGGYDVHYRTVHPATGAEKWVRAIGRTFYAPDGTPRRFDGVTLDVTDERRADERRRFLADLGAATQPLTDPEEVTAVTARLLAEHLRCDRCAYAAVEGEAVYVITGDHTRGVPSIVGRWPVASFGAEHHRMMRADEAYVVHDADADPRIGPDDLPAYRATRIQAVVCVPLHKDGRFTAAMAVHQATARRWAADEVELVRTVAGRCWEALERARADRALRESEANLRLITDSVPALIAFVDAGERYRFVNRQYEEWFGRPRSEIEGRPLREVLGEAAYEERRPFVERALAGERLEFEALAPYPAGCRHIHGALVPRVDGDRVTGYLSLITDVTSRVRAREELRASEARFRAFMDHSPTAGWITTADGRIQYLSGTYSRMFELPDRELVGATPADLYPEEFAQEYVRNIRAVAESGRPLETLERAPRPDGSVGEFLVYKFPLPGGLIGGVAVDITERLRAEERLREAEATLRAFFDASPVMMGLVELPEGGDIVHLYDDAAACRFFGVGPGGTAGRRASDLGAPPETVAEWRARYLESGAGRAPVRFDYRHDTSGGPRWLACTVAPLETGPTGRPRFSYVAEDVTERKRAEEGLREADRRKDEFLALLAHELRNPLAPLRNGLQVMRLAGASGETAEKARAMMDRQLTHMVRLVDDLLDVSRISRNKLELRRERVLLSDVVTSAVETARPAIDQRAHELSVSLPGEPVYLDADLTRLAQVLSNLLVNAAKYTERGGRIWLTAHRGQNALEVTVRDTGIGIPAEALSTIFDMFSQVDRSLERQTGGLGIGLALVKGLVEMHGGRVAAESRGPGAGSTFTVTLPVRPTAAPPGEAEPGRAGRAGHGPSRRVLVVDDNRDSAASMAAMLELLGHAVRTAHDGVEAVAAAEEFRPEVILMDVGMPRLNGYDATRRIRERSWARSVTVVALTGWGQEGDRLQSQAAGCTGHLVKPVGLADLRPYLETAGDG